MTDSDDANPALHDALTRLLATRNWVLVWLVMEAAGAVLGTDGTRRSRPPCSSATSKPTTSATRTSSNNAPDAVAALRARGDAEDWLAHGAALERDQLVAYALGQLADAESSHGEDAAHLP